MPRPKSESSTSSSARPASGLAPGAPRPGFRAAAAPAAFRLSVTNRHQHPSPRSASTPVIAGGHDLRDPARRHRSPRWGSVLALATIVGGLIITSEDPLRPGVAILLLGRGQHPGGLSSAGLFQTEWSCERWKIHSFIVNAGDGSTSRGGAALQNQQLAHDIFSFPRTRSTRSAPPPSFGVPIIFLMALGVVLAGRFILNRNRISGRLIYAYPGNNEEAVRLSGHAPSLYKVAAFSPCAAAWSGWRRESCYMMRLNQSRAPSSASASSSNAIPAAVVLRRPPA